MNSKILTLLGFASKARALSYGQAGTVEAIKAKKSRLTVFAFDISEKSKKEIIFHANKYQTQYRELKSIDMQTLSNAVGKSCGVLSVNENSFADTIKKLL